VIIVETIIASFTLIVLGSLAFANEIDKRLDDPRKPKVKLRPFEKTETLTTQCPFCAAYAAAANMCGPVYHHEICTEGEKCEAYGVVHMHMHCLTCKATWLTEPAKK
jgi:hypothetical protein